MSENTKIEWATHTFNPWEGCQKVGSGCNNCYAENRNARFGGGVAINWGPGAPRRRTSPANWRKPLAWNAAHAKFFAQHGYRQRVFCASLADVFDNAVDPQWRDDLWQLIWDTPNLDWLLLTKRIGNVGGMLPEEWGNGMIDHWPHVWIGATIVNQEEADRDIPKLLAVPAAKRFLSMEPLLGPVSLRWLSVWPENTPTTAQHPSDSTNHLDGLRRLDWIIVGGESGPAARPMHPDWARSLRDQCADAGVPFLFKQWGEWADDRHVALDQPIRSDLRKTIAKLTPAGEMVPFTVKPGPLTYTGIYRVGKKVAGRLLDGREWNGLAA